MKVAGATIVALFVASLTLVSSAPVAIAAPPDAPVAPAVMPPAVPAPLTNPLLSLRGAPTAVPLELRIPSVGVNASVLGVGLTNKNEMDAPEGPATAADWQQAFWYRGSAIPGAASTALIAGHISDPLGRPGVFANLDELKVGAAIIVHDTRDNLDVRFSITGTAAYSLVQTANPDVLTQIYGSGPVSGTAPQPSADGLSHLTLITCAGTFRNGTHDHRFVVYATRTA